MTLIPLLPSGKAQLMEHDALGVVGQAGFAKNNLSKNRPGIPVKFQRNSRSSLDSGRSPPEFRVTETRNSGFRWIPGSEFWSPADSGTRVLESGGIPGLEFCYVMAFQSRVWSPAEFRVWSSGVRLKIWGPAEFQTLSLAASQCSYYRCMDALKVFH